MMNGTPWGMLGGHGKMYCRFSNALRIIISAKAISTHGADGEWRVERQRLSWELQEAFREAATQSGIPPIDDFNRGN